MCESEKNDFKLYVLILVPENVATLHTSNTLDPTAVNLPQGIACSVTILFLF